MGLPYQPVRCSIEIHLPVAVVQKNTCAIETCCKTSLASEKHLNIQFKIQTSWLLLDRLIKRSHTIYKAVEDKWQRKSFLC